MSEQTKSKTVYFLLIAIFVVLTLSLFTLLNSIKNHNQLQHLRSATDRYHLAYNAIYNQHKQLAKNIHSDMTEQVAIREIYQELLTADEAEKNRLRAKLLLAMKPHYEELQQEAHIGQIQFHLPNNEAFLRLHRPELFGDDVSTIRETVRYVNKEHVAIDGFEEGKFYAGYRFVFPITAPDQRHLGTMELSFGPEVLTSAMMDQYLVLSNILVSEETVHRKIFPEELNKTFTPSSHRGFLQDRNVLAALQRPRNGLQLQQLQENTAAAVYLNACSGINNSHYAPAIDTSITTLPIFNPVTQEQVAFFTVQSRSDLFTTETRHFKTVFTLSLFLLITFLSIFMLQGNKKRILGSNTRKLEKERERLLHAQEIANIGDWELDIHTSQLNWSDQVYQIFGQDPENGPATFETFQESIHPADRDFVNRSYQDSLKNRQPYDIEHRIITPDGTEKWVRETCNTEYDVNGIPLRSHGIVHDITKQHNTLMTLQRERDMFMNGPVMTFTWENSKNWPVTRVSTNVSDLLGYSPEEFLDDSVTYSSCIHPDDLHRVTEEVIKNSDSGNSSLLHEPYRLIHRNKKSVWVLDCTTPVQNEQGETTHYQGYLVDITNMIQMEKEVQASRNRLKKQQQEEELRRCESLKTMAGAIAHRFNNSMTAVQGNLDLIALTVDDDSNEYRMATNAARAARGASQVGSLMLSYVGQQPLQLQEVSFFKLAQGCITSVKGLLQPSISFKITSPTQALYCSVDKEQMKEVLKSILSNAVESLANAPGTIEISFGSEYFRTDSFPASFQSDTLKDGTYSFCQIKDTGHGIAPKELSRIFEPFYTTRFVGRGLGLALTVGIMRSHSGAIIAASTPDVGTSVKVLLPSIPAVPQDEEEADEVIQLSGDILLADDQEVVLQVGKDMLTSLGFTVHTVVNGQEAVDMVRNKEVDFCAVLLDISMPEMDGIEAMETIRKISPGLPVVLSSGYSKDKFDFTGAQENAPDDFLPKPFRLPDMQNSLKKLLS